MKAEPEILDGETFGNATRYEVVRATEGDARSWISDAPICELLMTHHISHVGRMWAKPPFTVIRSEASGTFVLVGLEGEGETLIDAEWRSVKAGEICLLPAFAPAEVELRIGGAFEAAEFQGWKPEVKFKELVQITTQADWELAKKEAI